jgi:glycosyltransferase involved in cell wall biosynthesis
MINRNRVTVVHSHEFTMAVYGTAAAKLIRKPHVITHHAGPYYATNARRRIAMRWACRNSQHVVAVSRRTRDEFEANLRLPKESVRVIYNGIAQQPGEQRLLRRELGVPPNDILLLAVGTVMPLKGHALALEALADVRRRQPTLAWHMVIAGQDRDGESNRLLELAGSLGLSDRFHLLGHRSDIPTILAEADIFVMPSFSEGLPMALLEAMMAALPTVASRAGGIPEAITAGKEGLLFPVGNVGALATALEDLMLDSSLRDALGRNAREKATAAFSVQAMASEYERLYSSASESGQRNCAGAGSNIRKCD